MVSFQKTQKTFCSVYAKLLQINTLQFPVVLWREEKIFLFHTDVTVTPKNSIPIQLLTFLEYCVYIKLILICSLL